MKTYSEYVEGALRTECDYAIYTKALSDNESYPPAITQWLHLLEQASYETDAWKKHIIYGAEENKYLPFIRKNSLLFPAAVTRLKSTEVRRLLHALMGLHTETGEIAKVLRAHIIDGTPLDFKNIFEESGDLKWYTAILDDVVCKSLRLMDEFTIFVANIRKLLKRYPHRFTAYLALHRELTEE